MTDRSVELTLGIQTEGAADTDELEQLTRQLRDDLQELDLATVNLARIGQIPERAKAGDPISWGTLLLALAASQGVFTTLIEAIKAWLTRHERYTISLEIAGDKLEVTGLSSKEQQRLIDLWVGRHTGAFVIYE